jgi:hypothetical protein
MAGFSRGRYHEILWVMESLGLGIGQPSVGGTHE